MLADAVAIIGTMVCTLWFCYSRRSSLLPNRILCLGAFLIFRSTRCTLTHIHLVRWTDRHCLPMYTMVLLIYSDIMRLNWWLPRVIAWPSVFKNALNVHSQTCLAISRWTSLLPFGTQCKVLTRSTYLLFAQIKKIPSGSGWNELPQLTSRNRVRFLIT